MLEELQDRKGALSRMIGEAKRSGQPIDELLSEMKDVSRQLKQFQGELKAKKDGKTALQQQKPDSEQCVRRVPQMLQYAESEPISFEVGVVHSEDDKTAWDDYLAKTAGSHLYQYWAFKQVIERSFSHATYYLKAVKEGGELCGVLPLVQSNSALFGNYLVSVPFFNYGSVLADNAGIEKALIDKAIEIAREVGAKHLELRDVRKRPDLLCKQNKVSMLLALPKSREQLFENVGSKVRAQIRKAEKFRFEFRSGGSELLDDFYRVFSINMRDLGTPVYAKSFFANLLLSELAGQFTLAVLYLEGKPVSACFLMGHKDVLEIPWASTLRDANPYNANMFMYWHVLGMAIDREYAFFDFGRSSKDAGTYKFKRQWGAEPVPLYWHYWLAEGDALPELNPDNPKYKLLIAVWQKMPVWLTRLIGPPIVKYLP